MKIYRQSFERALFVCYATGLNQKSTLVLPNNANGYANCFTVSQIDKDCPGVVSIVVVYAHEY